MHETFCLLLMQVYVIIYSLIHMHANNTQRAIHLSVFRCFFIFFLINSQSFTLFLSRAWSMSLYLDIPFGFEMRLWWQSIYIYNKHDSLSCRSTHTNKSQSSKSGKTTRRIVHAPKHMAQETNKYKCYYWL